MSRRFGWVLSALALFVSSSALAGESPVQLALFDPVQIVKHDQRIGILRIDLLYGKNAGMTGLDVGLIGHTTGNQAGLAYCVVNITQGSFTGWQDSFISIADQGFLGLQSGAFNQSKDGHGVQIGLVNVTDRMSGLQFGVVNYTRVMTRGVQIGIGNIILEGGIPFLPIVNARF